MTGIIIVDKHEGISSFWAAAQVRRITREKKVGHTGTLDPMASGVLPVMLGGATKFCELLPVHDKEYRAKLLLGVTTDTLDITGTVLEQKRADVSCAEFEAVLSEFIGEQEQLPPMYSAVYKDGVRLYKLARQGIEVERETRKITIYSAEMIRANEKKGEFIIDVACSAGTYIRTLASDIGAKLGCGAVLTGLRRTAANGFDANEAHTIASLEQMSANRLGELVIPVDAALAGYPEITVSDSQSVRFYNGGALDVIRLRGNPGTGIFRVYSPEKKFLGLGEILPESGELTVKRILV